MRALQTIKASARLAAYRSFTTARLYNRALSAWEDRAKRPPIVVYQMGKVGSQAVVQGLERTLGRPVFHIHFLTPENLAWAEETYRTHWDRRHDPDHVWDSYHLQRRLARDRGACRWKVITLVRDPVARNLSSFFQVAERRFGLDLGRLGSAVEREATWMELTDAFLDRFDEHDVPDRWFDDELRTALGVDVYEAPFPARGWSLHASSAADVLVLQLERLHETAKEAFPAHLGVPVLPLAPVNVGGSKDYGRLYERFISEIRLPKAYLDRAYASRYAKHFYTPIEREELARRWAGGSERRPSREPASPR